MRPATANVIASLWSSMGLDDGAAQAATALDLDVVALDAHPRAEGLETGRDARDPVGFLVREARPLR